MAESRKGQGLVWPDIRLVQSKGAGIVDALNQGLSLCQSPVFVRMDADDIMDPVRLQRQLEHLEEVDISGCLVEPVGNPGPGAQEYFAWQNNLVCESDILANRYVECPLQHPTLAMPVNSLKSLGAYRDGPFPEDYDLFLRCLQAGMRVEKLPDTLLQYRVSENQLSRKDHRYSKQAFHELRKEYLARDLALHKRMSERRMVVWGASRRSRRRFEDHFPDWIPEYYVDIKPSLLESSGVPMARMSEESPGGDYERSPAGETVQADTHRSDRATPVRIAVRSPEYLYADSPRPFVLVYVNARGARGIIQRALQENGFEQEVDFLCIG